MKKKDNWENIDDMPEDFDIQSDTTDKASMSKTKRLIIGISAAVVVLILGLSLPGLLSLVGIEDGSRKPTESTAPEAAGLVDALFDAFAITACAQDWTETILQPSEPLTLNEYSPTTSSVPGFPFRADAPADGGIDNIDIEVSRGALITWNPPDYQVNNKGAAYTCAPGDTVYWSPLNESHTPVSQCLMTVTARRGQDVAYVAQIIISHNDAYSYDAELVSLKSYPVLEQ